MAQVQSNTGDVPPGNDAEVQRPFRLVRYYSVTSLVIILVFTFVISTVLSRRADELFLQKREQYALLLAENLNHQVLTRFVIPVIKEYGGINTGHPDQFALLDAVVRNTIHSFNVRQVNILDLHGNIIYSTQPEFIARAGFESPGFRTAQAGGHYSQVDPPRGYLEMGGGPTRVLKTFIPLRDERRRTAEFGAPRAVFEITQDITADFKEVWVNQVIIVSTLLGMMVLLFVILRSIVLRGQRVMDQRAAMEVKLKEQLGQAQRLAALGRMIAGVAHEIRNPLGIVRSTAELLGSRVGDDNKPLTQVIVDESSRLAGIVTEFLDFARPQQAQLKDMELKELLSHNLHVLEPEAQRLGVEVVSNLPAWPARVWGDSDLLYRAFLNVLSNAVQAMDETGGELTVSLRRDQADGQDYVVAQVADTGPGFDPKTLASLFDPFFTTKEKGSGLGLSIVQNIVASHQGKVELANRKSGGARVEVWLPAVDK